MLGSTWLRRCMRDGGFVSVTAGAQSRDMRSVARNLVQAGMVKQGDKVLINGSVPTPRFSKTSRSK